MPEVGVNLRSKAILWPSMTLKLRSVSSAGFVRTAPTLESASFNCMRATSRLRRGQTSKSRPVRAQSATKPWSPKADVVEVRGFEPLACSVRGKNRASPLTRGNVRVLNGDRRFHYSVVVMDAHRFSSWRGPNADQNRSCALDAPTTSDIRWRVIVLTNRRCYPGLRCFRRACRGRMLDAPAIRERCLEHVLGTRPSPLG